MQNQKITILIIILLVLLSIVGGFYFINKKNVQIPKNIEEVKNAKISVAEMANEKSQTEYLTADITYPVASQEKFPELYTFVDEAKREFMKNFDSLTPEDIKVMQLGGDRKYDFTVNTRVATSTNTVTYIVEAYQFTGGAHGGTVVGTFTYDIDGKFVGLDNVLQGDYLNTLSTLSRKHFYDILGDAAQNSGTEPNKENFSSWYLTPTDIVFIFGQYSVGPYVFGIQEFSIPKSSISNLISEKFK